MLSTVSNGEITSQHLPRASGFPRGRGDVPTSSMIPLCDSGRAELCRPQKKCWHALAFRPSPLLCCLSGGRVTEVCAAMPDPEVGSSHDIILG